MKKILVIVNQFPPFGGGGVMRALKFVKYLPSFGWNPVVVARDFSKDLVFKDESLLKEIPNSVNVYRFESLEPLRLQRNLKKLKNHNGNGNGNGKNGLSYITFKFLKKIRDIAFDLFLIPDKDMLWVIKTRKKVEEIIKNEKIDTIFTTSPPHSTHLIGYYIKKRDPKLKWVADFRDVWNVEGYNVGKRSIIHKQINKKLEKKILNKADNVLVVCDKIKEKTIQCFGDKYNSKISVIPNGYDEIDFKGLEEFSDNGAFTLTYAGSLLGYREEQKLLEGLELLKKKGEFKDIKLNLIGAISEKFLEKIENSTLNGVVNHMDFCSHKEALSNQNKSDVLLFIQTNIKEDILIPTGKLFELIRIGKPVFALAPDGIAKEILCRSNLGIVVNPDNPEEISEGLKDIYFNYEKYSNSIRNDSEFLKRHERKELTRLLSELLNNF